MRSLDFRELDNCSWKFREDRLHRAQLLGFDYISEAMIRLYEQFGSLKTVARLVGCTEGSVWYRFKQWNIPKNKQGGPRREPGALDVDKLRKVGKARESGVKFVEIGQRFGVSAPAAYQWYQKYVREVRL